MRTAVYSTKIMKVVFKAHEEKLEINDKNFDHHTMRSIVEDSLNDQRKELIERILDQRISGLSVILESLGDLGNLQAISRTCDNFGVQKLEIIETKGPMKWTNRTSQGAHKWVTMQKWYETKDCLQYFKDRGVQIVSTAFSDKAIPYTEVDFTKPTALLMGNESFGISEVAREMSDVECIIPSYGYSQSLNVSVAAAIVIEHATSQIRKAHQGGGDFNEEQREFFKSFFYFQANQYSRALMREHFKKKAL
ncbi:tRNA (guanosine-2'-O-)-methyltransferase [Halobacteriovorax marinus SJ]|uniref:tRNA (guanosine(18)-2'-O)-methyltransferase n=2 Tax=Halobacteriovorax marinus TaxID=97084 RepID=E1WXK8_HALMS|nr:tRNA (guanosine-2'-O-)-methyltransferase [Halobacteriovorax marinus SJ]